MIGYRMSIPAGPCRYTHEKATNITITMAQTSTQPHFTRPIAASVAEGLG